MKTNDFSIKAIDNFLAKCQMATASRSKEIRLTIEEANALSANICTLISRLQTSSDRIIELQDEIIQNKSNGSDDSIITVVMDAGEFKKEN